MKEQRWIVLVGGSGLAFGAAFVNTGLVLETGTSVSHLTGDIARISIDLAQWSPSVWSDASRVATAILGFFSGAVLAGVLIHHPALDLSRPYGRTITGIGTLFLIAAWMAGNHPAIGIGLAALGCGLQNALAARYRGVVLRTTHLTGLFTDFGVNVGMRLRGHAISSWKILIPFLLILAFFTGSLTAGLSHFGWHTATTFIGGLGYVFAGLLWSAWKRSPWGPLRASSADPA